MTVSNSHCKILIKQQKSARLLFLQDIKGQLLKLFALHMSILNDANYSSLLPSKGLQAIKFLFPNVIFFFKECVYIIKPSLLFYLIFQRTIFLLVYYRNEAPSPFTEDGTIQKKLFQNILSLITGSVNTATFSWQQVEKLAVTHFLWSSFLALHRCIRNLDFISHFVFLFPCFISFLSVFSQWYIKITCCILCYEEKINSFDFKS